MPQFTLPEATALLARTPPAIKALLTGLPDIWVHTNEGPNTWTAIDILAHLVDCERTNWLPRARMILEQGESQPFTPLDRFAQQKEQSRSLDQHLDEFATLRAANLAILQSLNLKPEDLTRRGTHPAFGPVTLAQLLATWTTHDLTHLHQLSRLLAHQYREAVGPWSAYLGVLKCTGHSSS
jgi:uncharacterized damage-inducible protein DinB